jgi:hypothetical protein
VEQTSRAVNRMSKWKEYFEKGRAIVAAGAATWQLVSHPPPDAQKVLAEQNKAQVEAKADAAKKLNDKRQTPANPTQPIGGNGRPPKKDSHNPENRTLTPEKPSPKRTGAQLDPPQASPQHHRPEHQRPDQQRQYSTPPQHHRPEHQRPNGSNRDGTGEPSRRTPSK